jgi:hypothetical protein
MTAIDSSTQASSQSIRENPYLILPKDSLETVTDKVATAISMSMRKLADAYQAKLRALGRAWSKGSIQKLLTQGPWLVKDWNEQCKKHHFTTVMPSELKEGQNPFDFVMQASNIFSIIDSGEALRIAQYQGLALCLGKETFEAAFSSTGLGHVNFCTETIAPLQPLYYLSRVLHGESSGKSFGDAIYLSNRHALITSRNTVTAFGMPSDLSVDRLHRYIHKAPDDESSRCSLETLKQTAKSLLKFFDLDPDESSLNKPIPSDPGSICNLNMRSIRWLAKVKGKHVDLRLKCLLQNN